MWPLSRYNSSVFNPPKVHTSTWTECAHDLTCHMSPWCSIVICCVFVRSLAVSIPGADNFCLSVSRLNVLYLQHWSLALTDVVPLTQVLDTSSDILLSFWSQLSGPKNTKAE